MNTFSTHEEVQQAIAEGRLTQVVKTIIEPTPTPVPGSSGGYGFVPKTIEEPGKFVQSEPEVSKAWRTILKQNPDLNTEQLKTNLDNYLDFVRTLPLYKDKSDKDFQEHVVKPVIEAHMQDPRMKYDYEHAAGPLARAAFAVRRSAPGVPTISDFVTKTIYETIPKALRDTVDDAASEFRRPPVAFTPMNLLQEARREAPKKMPYEEATKIVEEELRSQSLDKAVLDPVKILEWDIPNVINATAKFLLIEKAAVAAIGSPASGSKLISPKILESIGIKGLTENVTMAEALRLIKASYPHVDRIVKGASLLAVDSATTNMGGWLSNPSEKVAQTLESGLTGAGFGALGSVISSRLARVATVPSAIGLKNLVTAKLGGADTEEAMKQALEGLKLGLAFELAGWVQNRGAVAQQNRNAMKDLERAIANENPHFTPKQVTQHAKLFIALDRAERLDRINESIVKKIESVKDLTPFERQKLDRFKGLIKQKRIRTERDILTAEQVLAPQKFKSPIAKEVAAKIIGTVEQEADRVKLALEVNRAARRLNLSTNEVKALIVDATSETYTTGSLTTGIKTVNIPGRIDSLANLTNNQLKRVLYGMNRLSSLQTIRRTELALGLTNKETKSIRSHARNNLDIYGRVLSWADFPLSSDRTLRNEEIDNIKRDARLIWKVSNATREIKNQRLLNAINPKNWESTRYFFDYLTRVTGQPINVLKDKTEEAYKFGHAQWKQTGDLLLKEIGVSKSRLLSMNKTERESVANYLFYGNASYYNQLPTDLKRAVDGLERVVGEGSMAATKVRGIAWYNMNSAYSKMEPTLTKLMQKPSLTGKEKQKLAGIKSFVKRVAPPDINGKKTKPTFETIQRLVLEGRAAQREGKFYDWLHNQTWATRETYFMGDHEYDRFVQGLSTLLSVPEVVAYEQEIKTKSLRPNFLQSRKKGAKPRLDDNPFSLLERHLHRVHTLYEMYPHFEKFNNALIDGQNYISKQDKAAIDVYRDTLLGRFADPGALVRKAMKLNKFWWDGYSGQPTRFLYFGYRNLWQNFSMLPGQIEPSEFLKGFAKIALKGRSPQAQADFAEWFASNFSQKRQLWETLTLTEKSEFKLQAPFRSIMDLGNRVISGSDEFNRVMAFWPIYQSATDNLRLYREGKISSNKLLSRLKMRSLAPGEEQRLINLIKHNNDREFVKVYTKAKDDNANFVYDAFGRSIIEQAPANKMLVGLITWTRGAVEAYQRQVWRPIKDGLLTSNYKRSYEGVKNFVEMTAGFYLSSKAMENFLGSKGASWGRHEYGFTGIVQLSPLSPGLNWILDVTGLADTTVNKAWSLISDAEEARMKGQTPQAFLDSIGPKAANYFEVFVPMLDVMPTIMEKYHDKKGVTWYHILKSISPKYSPRFDKKLKTTHQDIVEKFITGVMNTERPSDLKRKDYLR